MFIELFRTKVAETSDSKKRNRIQDIFRENSIDYVVKVKDVNQRNAMDAVKLGNNTKVKLVYSFWVKKSQEKEAIIVLRDAK